jgi:hypothetical protein
MVKCVGDYGHIIPSAVFSSPLKLGRDPQVFGLDGKRYALASEPDAKKDVCCATVKSLTGDEGANVRDNFGTAKECGIDIK